MQTEVLNKDELNYIAPPDREVSLAYAAEFRYFRALQIVAVASSFLLVGAIATLLMVFKRPPMVEFIRVDDAGRMEVMHFKTGQYTVREAEARTAINNWLTYRFLLQKQFIDRNFKLNYDFMDQHLVQTAIADDTAQNAKILAGSDPEQDVEIKRIDFEDFKTSHMENGVIGSGQCAVDLYKIVDPSGQAQREHYTLRLRYVLNPTEAAERAKRNPMFQLRNPLGLSVVWFHLDRALD